MVNNVGNCVDCTSGVLDKDGNCCESGTLDCDGICDGNTEIDCNGASRPFWLFLRYFILLFYIDGFTVGSGQWEHRRCIQYQPELFTRKIEPGSRTVWVIAGGREQMIRSGIAVRTTTKTVQGNVGVIRSTIRLLSDTHRNRGG